MDATLQNTLTSLAATSLVAVVAWVIRMYREKRSVQFAIVTEILSLNRIAELRGYAESLVETAMELDSMKPSERPLIKWSVHIADHYSRVYVANLSQLGNINPRNAFLIVSFYQYADSFVRDVTEGGALAQGSNDPESFRAAGEILLITQRIAVELERRTTRYWLNWIPWLDRRGVFDSTLKWRDGA